MCTCSWDVQGLQEMKNELLMLYIKIALGILEDLPLASLGIAWVFMSESSLTEIQTLSFAQSMLMLGMFCLCCICWDQ